ncbi:MAG: polysaccharide deacetylase family protein [Syntrophomonadaceae bacterium]|nr:polysaccharide deacetylase family protein [Syntrophomonadaceae bacterium]
MKKLTLLILLLFMLFIISGCDQTSQVDSDLNQIPDQTSEEPAPQEPTAEIPTTPAAVTPAETTPQPDAVPADSKSWYFKPNQDHHTPQIDAQVQQMANDGAFYYALPQKAPQVYLTFDEGYEQGYTGQILDTLKQYQVPAVFFIAGHYLTSQPDLVSRMVAEGHQVANHTYNHPDLSKVSQERFDQELNQLEEEFTSLTDSTMAPFLRPPMGNYSLESLQWAKDRNYTTVFWSMAFHDWDPNDQPGADFSHQYVVEHVHPGAIILLHAVSESNTQALPRIIVDLRATGYEFALLPQ